MDLTKNENRMRPVLDVAHHLLKFIFMAASFGEPCYHLPFVKYETSKFTRYQCWKLHGNIWDSDLHIHLFTKNEKVEVFGWRTNSVPCSSQNVTPNTNLVLFKLREAEFFIIYSYDFQFTSFLSSPYLWLSSSLLSWYCFCLIKILTWTALGVRKAQ